MLYLTQPPDGVSSKHNTYHRTTLPDYQIAPLRQFYRPYFSPRLNSWEIDYAETTIKRKAPSGKVPSRKAPNRKDPNKKDYIEIKRNYLFCININSKYLYALGLEEGENYSLRATRVALEFIQNDLRRTFGPQAKINNIRADGARVFGTETTEADSTYTAPKSGDHRAPRIELGGQTYTKNVLSEYLSKEGISISLYGSFFTNKNRVIDRAIRTIRGMVGENNAAFFDRNVVVRAVEVYNHTPHSAFGGLFTPFDVQSHPDLEECFIRENLLKLEAAKKKQFEAGYFSYEPDDVLIIHMDTSKTVAAGKHRRVFNRLAVFNRYEYGNVNCSLLVLDKDGDIARAKNPITLPIYFTKFVTDDITNIPQRYLSLIFEWQPVS